MADDKTLVIRINGNAKDFLDELEKVGKRTESIRKILSKTAKISAAAFAGFAGAIALVTREYANYESALVGVGKTTDISGKKLEKFGKEFKKLSEEIPVSTNELLGIAQAAGQLGISGQKNIVKFTKTIARLGVATDLSGENAALTLAKILSITRTAPENVDRFGAAIVALGNKFEATESQIARNTQEVAKAAAAFNISAADAAALGTVLKSLGQEAQLGGSVVGKSLLKIQKAISAGGEKAALLSELTGIAGDQLQKTFADDATKVFQLFLEGVGNVEGGTAAIFNTLEKFGLKGDEVNKVLPVLARNYDKVNKAVILSNKAYQENTALIEESEKAFATLNSEKQTLINTATNLASSIGEKLAPTITELIIDLREFLQKIQKIDTEVASNIASFLKWGAVISGAVASIAAFLLGAIQISGIITALTATFGPAALGASAFWAALTGPIGLAVAGLVVLTAGLIKLHQVLNRDEKPETLFAINAELDSLIAKRKELEKVKGFNFQNQQAINNIRKEIIELKKLRDAKVRASEDFGTGSLLIRPEADKGVDLSAAAFGLENEQAIPFLPAEEEAKKAGSDGGEDAKTQAVDAGTKKRIELLKQENADLAAIAKARTAAVTEEEKNMAERKAEIQNEFRAANRIKNEEEKALAIENLKAKHQDELAEISEFDAKSEERRALARERELIVDAEFDALSKEQQALFTEEDRLLREENAITDDEIKKAIVEKDLADKQAEREKFIQDETKHGATVAKLNQFFRREDVQGAKNASAQLIQLTNSKNETLKGIGKAAASTNAAIATAEGAIKAYSSLAGIPIVGPGLGIAAAGALIAYGVEQQTKILGANTGGLVPSSLGKSGVDSVPAMLTPNEIIAPAKNFDEVVEGVASQRGFVNPDEGDGGKTITVILEPKDDLINFIEQKIVEAQIQNTNI